MTMHWALLLYLRPPTAFLCPSLLCFAKKSSPHGEEKEKAATKKQHLCVCVCFTLPFRTHPYHDDSYGVHTHTHTNTSPPHLAHPAYGDGNTKKSCVSRKQYFSSSPPPLPSSFPPPCFPPPFPPSFTFPTLSLLRILSIRVCCLYMCVCACVCVTSNLPVDTPPPPPPPPLCKSGFPPSGGRRGERGNGALKSRQAVQRTCRYFHTHISSTPAHNESECFRRAAKKNKKEGVVGVGVWGWGWGGR